jgi:FxLD family lantipeptide
MTSPLATLAPPIPDNDTDEDEFQLDLRIIESATPLVVVMCSTDDNCGTTCKPSACATSSNDPS